MGYTTYASIRPFAGGMQSITATSAAASSITITAATAASALWTAPNYALISVEAASGRWRDDGTDPTPTLGMPLQVTTNNALWVYDGDLSKLKFISITGSCVVNISLYSAGP